MEKIPYHLAIIPDGNRRWARKNGVPTFEGHKRGIENFKKITSFCKKKGIKILTFFTFSTENWKRPKAEINYLMRLFKETINSSIEKLHKEGVRLKVIGERKGLPKEVIKAIERAESLTKNNKEALLNLALNYGGRREIISAIEKIIKENKKYKITENVFERYLWTKDLPDPDLIIRTGGEKRISNFLIWQMAYSELYFSKKFWPDFTTKDLSRILKDYQKRERRFGK